MHMTRPGVPILAITLSTLLAACSGSSGSSRSALNASAVGDSYMQGVSGAAYNPADDAGYAGPVATLPDMGMTPRQSMPLSQAIQMADRPTGEMFVHGIPGRQLNADEIEQVAEGNTMIGPKLSVHYGDGGDAEMVIFNQRFSGEWRVSGSNMMCHSFPSFAPWSGHEVCYEWYLDGNRLSTFEPVTGAGATRGENVLVAGNRVQ